MSGVALLLLAGLAVAVVLAGLHQWVVASHLLELGERSWSPFGAELSARGALSRGLPAAAVPLAGWIVAAALVLAAPFRVWIWGLVAILALTVTLSPLLAVYRYDTRALSGDEAARLASLPAPADREVELVVVLDSRDGPLNGYAIGGPFRDVIGVSEFALERLPADQVAALVAHEACHHEERHVLVRGAASLAILSPGAALLTGLFESLVPLATLGLVALVALERVVAHLVMRRLEYRADTVAARQTSVAAVRSLLTTLAAATPVDQERVPRWLRVFSTHPRYRDRLALLARLEATEEGPDASAISGP